MQVLEKLLIRELEAILNRLKTGNCQLSEEEQSAIMDAITHTSMSAEEVCDFLNISRATMTNHIRDGIIPKGRKLKGRKELIWFKDEIRKIARH